MGFQFHETKRGQIFFEGQLPRLIGAIERLADASERLVTKKQDTTTTKDFGDSIGNYIDSSPSCERTLHDIMEKYEGVVLCLAFSQLQYHGIKAMREIDLELECKKARAANKQNSLISEDVEEQVIRCAYEMSLLGLSDIIRFAKVHYPLYGVFVQEGKFLHYCQNATGEDIMYVRVDSETPDELIDDVNKIIEERAEKYGKEHNDDYLEYDFRHEIIDAFRTAGINPEKPECYKEFYL